VPKKVGVGRRKHQATLPPAEEELLPSFPLVVVETHYGYLRRGGKDNMGLERCWSHHHHHHQFIFIIIIIIGIITNIITSFFFPHPPPSEPATMAIIAKTFSIQKERRRGYWY